MERIVYETTGMGKFGAGGGTVAEYFYEKNLDGSGDEDCGSIEENGEWFGFFDLENDPIEIVWSDTQTEICVAAILSEDSQGFVSVETFADFAAARDAWSTVENSIDEFNDPN